MQALEVNYLAILVCAILSMVVGGVWYGALFGKKWMEIIGSDPKDKKAMAEMQKGMGSIYLLQFMMSLFQVYVFAYYVKGWSEVSGVMNGLWIWAAFIVPTLAGSVMWTREKPELKKSRFLIQAGYQLVLFILFGIILGAW